VPAETQRLQRRITPRDRWFVAVLACAALVGTPAAVLLSSHDARPGADAGCVTTVRASIMGGATYKYCGARAATACRQFGGDDKRLAARCEALGYLPPGQD
jgi:hypothetical protein